MTQPLNIFFPSYKHTYRLFQTSKPMYSYYTMASSNIHSIYIDIDEKQQNECLMTPSDSKNTLVRQFETAYMYAIRRKQNIQCYVIKISLLNSADYMSSVSKAKLVYTELTFGSDLQK